MVLRSIAQTSLSLMATTANVFYAFYDDTTMKMKPDGNDFLGQRTLIAPVFLCVPSKS